MDSSFGFSNKNGSEPNIFSKSNDIPLPPPPAHILALSSFQSELSLCSESPYQMPPPPPNIPASESNLTNYDNMNESIVPPPMPIIHPPRQPKSANINSAGALSLSFASSKSQKIQVSKSSPPIAVPPRISSCVTTTKSAVRSSDVNPISIMKTISLPPLQIHNSRINAITSGSNIQSCGSSDNSTLSGNNAKENSYCNVCGQMHSSASNHMYSYASQVLSELICQICNNPLVDPLQTKCSHTFCAACLKSKLATDATCPEDNQIINYLECSPAANIVKSLLDKLTIYCPNESCKEKLSRVDLEAHLLYWCYGNSGNNQKIIAPHSTGALSNKWDCNFEKSPHTTSTTVTMSSTNSVPLNEFPASSSTVNNCDDAPALSSSSSDACNNTGSNTSRTSGVNNKCSVRFEPVPQTRVKYYSSSEDGDTMSGTVSTVIIERSSNDLGISFVGGYDTPLQCIIIQEIYLDGAVAKDGRLRPGDQITSINDLNLNQATHVQAKHVFHQIQQQHSTIRLNIFREKAVNDESLVDKEILEFCLSKRIDKKLGIKLVGQKNKPGLYVLDLVKGSEADLDGRLRKNDRILSINDVDLMMETQDTAARVINNAEGEVKIRVARLVRPPMPDLIKNANEDVMIDTFEAPSVSCFNYMELIRKNNTTYQPKEKRVSIEKNCGESLGMSVAGGINSQRGDTPVYVTNLVPDGVVARTGLINKGDILLRVNDIDLVGLTHERAVAALKSAGKHFRHVVVLCLSGPEVMHGAGGPNFLPSWVYWLQLPRLCELPRVVSLRRESAGSSLGFSIVGGADPATANQMSPSRFGGNQNGRYSAQSTYLQSPIVMKSIVIGSVAHRNGSLKCGDILLKVNKTSLINVTHEYAVNLFKNVQDEVVLHVVSWPGTIV